MKIPPGWLNIYMPAPTKLPWIRPHSGVVGTPTPDSPPQGLGNVLIDFEGNVYDAANLRTWRERVLTAQDRHRTQYPTVARGIVMSDEVVLIGVVDEAGHFDFIDEEDLTPEQIEARRLWCQWDRPE